VYSLLVEALSESHASKAFQLTSSLASIIAIHLDIAPPLAPPQLGPEGPDQTRRWVDTVDAAVLKTLSTLEKKRQQVIYGEHAAIVDSGAQQHRRLSGFV